MLFNILLSTMMLFSFAQTNLDPLTPSPNKPLGEVIPIDEAVEEFEKSYNKKIQLPEYLPFIPTITGANLNKNEKRIRVDYLKEKTNDLLSIHIYSGNQAIESEKKGKSVLLENKIRATVIQNTNMVVDMICFKKDGLTYIIAITKTNKNFKTLNELIKTANSLA